MDKNKPEYPSCPPLNWVSLHDSNSSPESGEKLYMVSACKQVLAGNRFQARRGLKQWVNTGALPIGYALAHRGQVFTQQMLVIKTDDEALLKERKAEAAATIKRWLEERAIVEIGTVAVWGNVRWEATLSPEGKAIVEDWESYILSLIETVPAAPHDPVAPEGEDLFLVAKKLSMPGHKPLIYPALVAESVLDFGYRPDPERRKAEGARLAAEGVLIPAGRVFKRLEETPNILTGKHTRLRVELKKEIRAELEALAEGDFYDRVAKWQAERRAFEPTRLGRY